MNSGSRSFGSRPISDFVLRRRCLALIFLLHLLSPNPFHSAEGFCSKGPPSISAAKISSRSSSIPASSALNNAKIGRPSNNNNDMMPSPTSKQQRKTTPRRRFDVGDPVMCNCRDGWMLGRVIALDYREDRWPESQPTAPYQVMLESSSSEGKKSGL